MSGEDTLSRQQRRGLLIIGLSICLVFGILLFKSKHSQDTTPPVKKVETHTSTPRDTTTAHQREATHTATHQRNSHHPRSKTKTPKKSRATTPAPTPPRDHLAEEIPAQATDQNN